MVKKATAKGESLRKNLNLDRGYLANIVAIATYAMLVIAGAAAATSFYAHEEPTKNNFLESPSAAEFVGSVKSTCGQTFVFEKAKDKLFYLNGTVNGAPVEFLIDTGANRSSVSLGLAMNGKTREALQKQIKGYDLVETASGIHQVPILGAQKVTMAGNELLTDLLLFPSIDSSAIVGLDLLSSFKIVINNGTMELTRACS